MTNRVFETGSQRDVLKDKPRYDLNSPIAARALAVVNGYGASRYSDRNWELGQPLVEGPYGSLMRHLEAWRMGEELDPDSGLSHLWHVLWNAQALVHLSEQIKNRKLPDTLDDRFKAPTPALPKVASPPQAVEPPTGTLTAQAATRGSYFAGDYEP